MTVFIITILYICYCYCILCVIYLISLGFDSTESLLILVLYACWFHYLGAFQYWELSFLSLSLFDFLKNKDVIGIAELYLLTFRFQFSKYPTLVDHPPPTTPPTTTIHTSSFITTFLNILGRVQFQRSPQRSRRCGREDEGEIVAIFLYLG